jgi:hypothetical protein
MLTTKTLKYPFKKSYNRFTPSRVELILCISPLPYRRNFSVFHRKSLAFNKSHTYRFR